jgi:apolipoprotein N-acyltransferase
MIKLSRAQRFLLSSLAGILMVLCFPFTGSCSLLAFVSWIPLLWVEHYISKQNYKGRKVFFHAYWCFLIFNLGSTWWIYFASLEGALMAFICNSLVMAIAFWSYYFVKKRNGIISSSFLLIIFWLGFEYVHLNWELSYPWLNLGNIFSIHPEWVQWYSVTGIEGGSLWVLLVNLFGFWILTKFAFKGKSVISQWKAIGIYLLAILTPILLSYRIYSSYEEKIDPINITVIQPNVDPYIEKFNLSLTEQLGKIFDEGDKVTNLDTRLVLAPETALSYGFYESSLPSQNFYRYLIQRKSKWKKAGFYIGASTARFFETKHSSVSRKLKDGPGYEEYYNTSLYVNPQNQHEFIHKSKLVLGVEKLPFQSYFPWLDQLAINLDGASGTLGIETEPKVYRDQDLCFAPCICYESIYGEFLGQQCQLGAEFIGIITNDGWWRDTPGYKQHASFARLRAVENRRSVARSANTGISSFINQRGDVLQHSSWWVSDALNQTINKNKELTFYSKHGDYLARLAAVLSLFLFVFSFFKWIKHKFGNGNEHEKSV